MLDIFTEVCLKKTNSKLLKMKFLFALTFLTVLAMAYGVTVVAPGIGSYYAGSLAAPVAYGGLGYYGAGIAAPYYGGYYGTYGLGYGYGGLLLKK